MSTNEWCKLASQANLWYNRGTKIVVSGGAVNTPDRTHLYRRRIMDSLSPRAQSDNSSHRNYRTGPLPRPLTERFWEKVDIGSIDDCWEWKACTYHNGYGKFALTRSKPVYAHRLAFEITNGSIPTGLYICHTCDNPRCCNPHHLFAGTQTDNMQDCKRKGRNSPHPRPKIKGAL
jgi:hypothetical protein